MLYNSCGFLKLFIGNIFGVIFKTNLFHIKSWWWEQWWVCKIRLAKYLWVDHITLAGNF